MRMLVEARNLACLLHHRWLRNSTGSTDASILQTAQQRQPSKHLILVAVPCSCLWQPLLLQGLHMVESCLPIHKGVSCRLPHMTNPNICRVWLPGSSGPVAVPCSLNASKPKPDLGICTHRHMHILDVHFAERHHSTTDIQSSWT